MLSHDALPSAAVDTVAAPEFDLAEYSWQSPSTWADIDGADQPGAVDFLARWGHPIALGDDTGLADAWTNATEAAVAAASKYPWLKDARAIKEFVEQQKVIVSSGGASKLT